MCGPERTGAGVYVSINRRCEGMAMAMAHAAPSRSTYRMWRQVKEFD